MKPTIGRIVEYTTTNNIGQKVVRPAIIVAVWNETLVNLQVFTDGFNDNPYGVPVMWKTSVRQDSEKNTGTWDWMEYQKGQAAKTEELEGRLQAESLKSELPRIPTTPASTPTPFVCPDTQK